MKKIQYLLFCLISLSLCYSCREPENKILVAHILSEPLDLHPTNGSSAIRAEFNLYTHLSLTRVNYKNGELIPCLVKSLPTVSSDGLNYTYELKDNMTWDDSSAITAHDVAFTIKATKCLLTDNPGTKSNWENIKDIIIDSNNNKKFTIQMKHASYSNNWHLSCYPIVQELFYDKPHTLAKYSIEQLTDSTFLKRQNDIKQWADEFNSAKYYSDLNFISGCGPYKISKWDKGISITLEKKKPHWTDNCQENEFCQAYPDKIIFKVNNNNSSTLLELKNGLIDVSTMVDFSSFMELSKDESFTKNYVTKLASTYNYLYVAMNMKPDGRKHKKIFDDVLVRKAMAIVTPYEQLNKLIYENTNKRMIGPVSQFKPDFNTNLKAIDFNLEKSKALLKQAGWMDTDNDQILDKLINGEKVNLEFDINFLSTQKQWEDIAKQLAESMRKINVFARLNPVDYNGFLNAASNHDFDMLIGAWQGNSEPDNFAQLWKTSSWTDHGLNFSGFGNAVSDALIDSINNSVTDNRRISLSKQFQQMVYDQQPYIFLFSQSRRVIVSKKWENLEIYTDYPGVLLNTLKYKE